MKQGVHGVFQSHHARKIDFESGTQLGKLDHLTTWDKPKKPAYMTDEEYDLFPDTITVREVNVSDEFGTKDQVVLATTLLDPEKYPRQELADLYRERWRIEVALRDMKVTMGMGHIAAKTPEVAEKMIWAYVLGYNFVRWYIANAAMIGDVEIENISVMATLSILFANLKNLSTAKKSRIANIRSSIIYQMLQCHVGLRKGRSEPRAVKRRPKKSKYLKGPRSQYSSRVCA